MRNLILIFSITLFSLSGISQSYKLGVYAEPTVGWLKSQSERTAENDASSIGFGAGIVFDYYFADNYAFSSGLGLSVQGGDLKYHESITVELEDQKVQSPDEDFVLKYSINYLDIPVGLKFKTNQIGYFTYFFDLGFDLQVCLSAKANSEVNFDFNDNGDYDDEEDDFLENTKITKDINFMNISYHVGGGIEYGLSESTTFFAGLFYRNGFTDITAQNNIIDTRIIALRIGLMF